MLLLLTLLCTTGAFGQFAPPQKKVAPRPILVQHSGGSDWRLPAYTENFGKPKCDPVSARADLLPGVDAGVSGTIFFFQSCGGSAVQVYGRVSGLSPGKHGMHVHELPDLTEKCDGAGPHYNPLEQTHGGRTTDPMTRHIGDLGNIVADKFGVAEFSFSDDVISLFPGSKSVFGRTLIVHALEDDLGEGGDEESLITGNAGMRLACGIIAPNGSPVNCPY